MNELRHVAIKLTILHVYEELPAVEHPQKSILSEIQLLERTHLQLYLTLRGYHAHIARLKPHTPQCAPRIEHLLNTPFHI